MPTPNLTIVEDTAPLTITELKQAYEVIEREHDRAGFDQKVAALFKRSRLSQQEIGDALGLGQQYVSRLLCLGRFVALLPNFTPSGVMSGELTERGFRKLWDNTTGRDEDDRFRQVLRAMGHDVIAPAAEPVIEPAPRRGRVATNRLIEEIAAERGVTSGQRLSDIRNVVEHGEPNIVAMVRANEVGLQAAASYARATARADQVGATPAAVRRVGNQVQAVGRTAARTAAPAPRPPRSEPRLVSRSEVVTGGASDVILTREQIDPEFTGTDAEFRELHSHTRVHTAEQQATSAFGDLAARVRALSRSDQEYARQNNGSSIRINFLLPYWMNWLRSPSPRDTARLREALEQIMPLIEEAQAALARATAT
jgi:hypothetical protein